ERNSTYAIINATIHPAPGQTIENGKLLFKDGKILAIGTSISIPIEAIILNAKDKHIYPAFIEPYSDYGVERGKKSPYSRMPQYERKDNGLLAWNAAITPEVDAALLFKTNASKADALRRTGFATILTHQQDGIVRGTGLLVHLNNDKENETV